MSDKFCPEHTEQNNSDRDRVMIDYKEGIKGSLKERHDKREAQERYNINSRDEVATAFYSTTRWKKVANHVRVRDNYLSAISKQILGDGDTQVDHIVKRELLPKEDWYDTENLWLLSRREHQLKTSMESKMIRDGKGDMLRNLDREWWRRVLIERLEYKTKF